MKNQLSRNHELVRIREVLSLIRVGYTFGNDNVGAELASFRASQLAWAKRLLLVGIVVSILTSVSVCFVRFFVDPSEPPASVWLWLAFALFNIVQGSLGWYYINRPGRTYKEWFFTTLFTIGLFGLMWGLLPVWLFPHDNSVFHYFAITILTGSCCLSVMFCFSAIHTSTAFIICSAIPFMLSKAGSTEAIDLNWTGWSFVYNFFMLVSAHSFFYLLVRQVIQANTIRTINNNFESQSSDWRWEIDSGGKLAYLSEKMKTKSSDGDWHMQEKLQDYLDASHHGYARVIPLIEKRESFSNVIVKGTSAPNDKHSQWWSISSSVLKDFQGRYIGAAGVCLDISRSMRIQQIEEEKARLDSITQMSSTIAHDFNNNLMAIQGFVDLVNTFPSDSSKFSHLAPTVQVSVTRSSRMIEQLLSYVKRDTMQCEMVDLGKLLNYCIEESRLALGDALNLEFSLSYDVKLLIDSMLLQRAVMNLIRNAAESPGLEDKKIRMYVQLKLSKPNDNADDRKFVSIVVEDNGSGIDDIHFSKIFDPFYTSKRQNHGAGLGLSMVKGFAEQSGGYVTAENTSNGARFTLTLPIKQASTGKFIPKTRIIEETSLLGISLLVVEDNEPYLDVLCSTARNDGAKIAQASTIAGGVAMLRSGKKFDVLITDLLLPDGLGTELLLLAKKLHPDIVIVAITAFDNQLWSEHERQDNTAMLKKPFHYSSLRTEILTLLHQKKMAKAPSKRELAELPIS